MIIKLFIFICLFFYSFSSITLTKNDLTNNQLLCSKLFWGFEFISPNKVKVIETDLNNVTKIKEYNYNVDLQLGYINIYSNQNKKKDRVYSVEFNSLRIDVWAMTGGGYTTREMFPIGLCEFVEIDNFLSYIESLK